MGNNDFKQRLALGLSIRKMTQSSLAKQIGVSSQAVGYYLSGKNEPSLDNLIKISKCLNVSTDWLLGLSNYAENKITPCDYCTAQNYFPVDDYGNSTACEICGYKQIINKRQRN